MGRPSSDSHPPASHDPLASKKGLRAKPIKRRSLLGGHNGDSTHRVHPAAVDTTSASSSKSRDKEMATSFLQYCAMCERQIMTPSNSILYCSEACRRKDSVKPLSASLASLSPPRPVSMPSTPLPTVRIPVDLHDHKPDLDPTEWKPKLHSRQHSEAFRYLSRFHQTMNNNMNDNANTTSMSNDTPFAMTDSVKYKNTHERPPATTRNSTMSAYTTSGSMTTPNLSLNNTPTTTATTSSFDSMYEFNLRPLPPRQNPMYYSASTCASKGIDLVTPHIPPPTSTLDGAASVPTYDHDFWGKKVVVYRNSPSVKGDGLGALFGKSN